MSEPSNPLFGNLLTFRERPSAGAPLLVTERRTAPRAAAAQQPRRR